MTGRLLLEQFERSLAIFEDDLAGLLAEQRVVEHRNWIPGRAAANDAPTAAEDNG